MPNNTIGGNRRTVKRDVSEQRCLDLGSNSTDAMVVRCKKSIKMPVKVKENEKKLQHITINFGRQHPSAPSVAPSKRRQLLQ